jgi:hypothetical protein
MISLVCLGLALSFDSFGEARCAVHFFSNSQGTTLGSAKVEKLLAKAPKGVKSLEIQGSSCQLFAFAQEDGVGKYVKFETGVVEEEQLSEAFGVASFRSFELWHAEELFEIAHVKRLYAYIIAKTYNRLKLQAGNRENVRSMLGRGAYSCQRERI